MRTRIGQILVADGVVNNDAVIRALGYQEEATEPFRLGTILLGWDLVSEESLLAALEKRHRCASVSWERLALAPIEAIRSFPKEKALRLGAVPFKMEPGKLRMVFRDPSNLLSVDEASQIAGKMIVPLATTEVALALAHKKFYAEPIPNQLRPITQKLGRRRVTPGAGIAITRPVEAVPVAAEESSGTPEWPFWTPEESLESARPEPADERLSWIRTPEFAPAEEKTIRLQPETEARSRHQVTAPVIETLLAGLPRVIVFGVGKTGITGWAGRGTGLSRDSVSRLRIPAQDANVLAEVAATGAPHFGPVGEERYPGALPPARGDRSCAVFPIRVLDSVAGLLYADRLGDPMPFEDFALVARGAASAASLLSRFLLTEEDGGH